MQFYLSRQRLGLMLWQTIWAVVATQLIMSAPANAYDRANAAQYADNWWNAQNATYPQGLGNDCTNFISQALHAGGIKLRQASFSWSGSYSTSTYRDAQGGLNAYWTTTWTVAQKSANWVNGLAGSTMTSLAPGNHPQQPPVGYRERGDVIYYDFGDDGSPDADHATIIVVKDGTSLDSENPGTGTLVDGHTKPRHHALWNLWGSNGHRNTTTYFPLAVGDGAT